MSQLNVTHMKLRRNSYSTLGAAIQHAGVGDTIVVHENNVSLPKNMGNITIDRELYISGANPSNPPTFNIDRQQVGFLLKQGDFSLSNMNINLSPQSNGISTLPSYTGTITLKNVKILHKGGIKPREYWPSMSVYGQNGQALSVMLNMDHCAIDDPQLSVAGIKCNSCKFGKLAGALSILVSFQTQITGSELTHVNLQNGSPNANAILQNVSTKGMLSLTGNFVVNGLLFKNGIQKTNHPLGGLLGTNPVTVLHEFGVGVDPHGNSVSMPLLMTNSYKGVIDQVQITDIKYDPTFKNIRPSTALVHPYSFNFHRTSIQLNNSVIWPNIFGDKNLADGQGTALSLADVQDKSEWNVGPSVSLSKRGSTNSELFSHLPMGNVSASQRLDPMKKLKSLIGLNSVKETLLDLIAAARIHHIKEINHQKTADVSVDMIFQGDPGTGKTTVARLVGKILYEKGVIQAPKFVEAEGDNLKGRYVGEASTIVDKLVARARGGVLFIDEAYRLAPQEGENNSFASDALAELVAQMENHKKDLVVIMAGYKYPMQQLMKGNDGLQSRFTNVIDFPDYTDKDKRAIMQLMINQQGLQLADDKTGYAMVKGLKDVSEAQTGPDGNARMVRNYVRAVVTKKDRRLMDEDKGTAADDNTLTLADVQNGTKTMLKDESNRK